MIRNFAECLRVNEEEGRKTHTFRIEVSSGSKYCWQILSAKRLQLWAKQRRERNHGK